MGKNSFFPDSVISQHLSSECWHDGLFTFFKNENIKPKKKTLQMKLQ